MSDAPQKEKTEKEMLIDCMNAVLKCADKALAWARTGKKEITEGRLGQARQQMLEGFNTLAMAFDALEPTPVGAPTLVDGHSTV